MFLLYNFLLTITSPIWALWMLIRTNSRKERPIWAERFGNYSFSFRKDRTRIWIHAVSVGEVVACLPILRELRKGLPDYEIVLSTTTTSGHRTAEEQANGLFDHLVYFPIDVARFSLAAMQRVQPRVVATIDTELWMNFLWAAKTFRATTMLINGRISERSYPRSRRVAFFYRALLQDVDRCLMQTQLDAERIEALGGQNVEVFGNVKFDQAMEDLAADPSEWRRLLKLPPGLPVLVVGSTRSQTEEELVIKAVKKVGLERLCVVHAPRHLERVPELAREVSTAFGSVALRSKNESGPYLILDSYGELSKVYSVADIVVVGGGFDPLGGQNILQPLAHGKPVVHGPNMENFKDVSLAAKAAGATLTVPNADELAAALEYLLGNNAKAKHMGEAARRFVETNTGAAKRYAQAIIAAAQSSKAGAGRQ